MKKLLFLLLGIISIGAVAQNGKTEILLAPNSNSPYILVDTLFTLEDTSITTDMTTQFTFVFDVVSPLGWTTPPLRIFNKAAGDKNAYDVNIKPSPNDGSVVNKTSMDPEILQLVQSFKVFPNPVSEITNNWLVIEHINDYKNSNFSGVIYDINGRIVKGFTEKIYERGYQYHGINLNEVPPGFYIVKLVTLDREKFFKIVKY